MSGYSVKVVRLNERADPSRLGVRLGRLCIENDIPVVQVCRKIGVSKATVYGWFSGYSDVSKHLRAKVVDTLAALGDPPNPPAAASVPTQPV